MVTTWVLEAHELHLLRLAAEALDRVSACRERIAAEGLTVEGKDGALVRHPLLSVEARCRDQARALIAQLRLPETGATADRQKGA